jgi:hypothetical protein
MFLCLAPLGGTRYFLFPALGGLGRREPTLPEAVQVEELRVQGLALGFDPLVRGRQGVLVF